MKDLMNAIRRYDLWMALGWNDVLGRYRRSVLGPFWITISMGITLAAMGPLYGSLFGNKDNNFLQTEIKRKEIERKKRFEEIDEEIKRDKASECSKDLLDDEEEQIIEEVDEPNDFLIIK